DGLGANAHSIISRINPFTDTWFNASAPTHLYDKQTHTGSFLPFEAVAGSTVRTYWFALEDQGGNFIRNITPSSHAETLDAIGEMTQNPDGSITWVSKSSYFGTSTMLVADQGGGGSGLATVFGFTTTPNVLD